MMKSNREPRSLSAFWLALLGFALGLLVVIVSTGLAMYDRNLSLTLDEVIRLHTSEPLLWAIDAAPFLSAIVLGIVGGRLDTAYRDRWLAQQAILQRDAEVKRLTAEVAAEEQAREQLDLTIGRGKRDWEATFDAVENMILVTDVGGKILRCNRATSHAFQEGFENLIGRQIDDLFFGALQGGQFLIPAQRTEMRFQKLGGWFEVSTNPIMVEEGRAATIYVIRDITARKQAVLDLSRQKEYYEALVRNSPFAIVTLNLDSRVVACNPAFEEMFGYNEMDIIGHEIDELVSPPEVIEETRSMTETVQKGEVIHKITRRQRKNGSRVDVEVFGIPVVLWGKQIGILALYHDISGLVALSTDKGQDAPAPARTLDSVVPFSAEPAAAESLQLDETQETLVERNSDKPASPPPALDIDEQPATSSTANKSALIESIEGIGPAYSSRLSEAGIRSTADLLSAGASRKDRRELAKKTGFSAKLILRWVNIADLMRIPGIGEEYSQLLEAAGVDTIKELRGRRPENLHSAILQVNQEKNLVRRPPNLGEVEAWVQAAGELEPLVEY